MNDLSNIGFEVETMEDFKELVVKACNRGKEVPADNGYYMHYSDKSGAEIWAQINSENNIIGAHPHFKGKSKRTVCLVNNVEREGTHLDGAYYAWANPKDENNPESGDYPFVFDVPNFKTNKKIKLPQNVQIQLTAFAWSVNCYDSEEEFDKKQNQELKYAVQSFIPSGLFSPKGEDTRPAQAHGIFTGNIIEWEKRTNEFSGKQFYWLLVETLGGQVDVVADEIYFDEEPKIAGVIHGQFWLSGCILNT